MEDPLTGVEQTLAGRAGGWGEKGHTVNYRRVCATAWSMGELLLGTMFTAQIAEKLIFHLIIVTWSYLAARED